jgi:Protein of unknown function (DUF3105)
VSSRQEEKERRRREREERERAAAAKASSRRRLQLVAGAVLAIAAVAAVVAAIASGGGDSKGKTDASSVGTAAIPARKISDFNEAVKAAGCIFKTYPSEGRTHLPSDNATFNKYKTNPPTSGSHRPTPAQDGVYERNNPPAKENAVHALEHGRIEIEYASSITKRQQAQLNTLINEPLKGAQGYHQLLFQNNTHMPYQVAAVAWTQLLGCKTMNDKTFDAIRAFRERFVDKGPELIP